ncbi:MAG: hypothetical protein EAZ08_03325 [Cytophagales bacterium]|nr:MAG: hypothetical protein EAZ08_03325 [Cytophagales bacterium]
MLKSRFIIRFYSIFFLILILCSLIGSGSHLLASKEDGKKKEISTKADGSKSKQEQKKDSQEQERLIEKPFNAVVNAGLQWDFQKQFCLVAPFVVFLVPQKINVASYEIITPLSYFVTLFHTSICVNAP